jgi:hypothetical protein
MVNRCRNRAGKRVWLPLPARNWAAPFLTKHPTVGLHPRSQLTWGASQLIQARSTEVTKPLQQIAISL